MAALLPSVQDMYGNVAEVMQALVDGDLTKLGELGELGTSFQETTERFQEPCAAD